MSKNTPKDLYRVNYQYVSEQGQLRAGSIVCESDNSETAVNDAAKLIPSNHKFAKMTRVTLFQLGAQR